MDGVTDVTFSSEARNKLLEGIQVVGDCVGCTLGPRGKTVIIQQPGHAPLVTKDGVSVAKAIHLSGIPGLGSELIKQAADRTNEIAGDGTTTATVLTQAMVVESNRLINNGNSTNEMCQGVERAVEHIVAALRSSARKINNAAEIEQVATISANGDPLIGRLVAEAMEKVGRDGIITVEDAKGMNTSLEVVEGMQFERGYLSPYFVTNNERMHASYENTKVLITDKKLSDLKPLVPILERIVQSRLSLLIIADDVDGEALQTLVLNRVKSNLSVVAVKAPGYGAHRDELLLDLCALTGAKLVSGKTGLALDKLQVTDLGSTKKIVVDAKTTTIVADGQTVNAVKARTEELRTQMIDVTLNVDEVTKLKTRIARLASGVAVIRVGGSTELEMVERKHRIEDALHATRAAAEEGIVPGGGMALLKAAVLLDPSSFPDNERIGFDIVVKACQAPLRRIVLNAGGSPDVVINAAIQTPANQGYDALTTNFCDMFERGIVDPVKVVRTALQHAASVAITFMTLDAVIHQQKDEQ
jgi:chaperonin GroEL